MNYRVSLAVALGIILAAVTARAHHNNVRFDQDKLVTVTGTLTKLDWRNPHIYMYMDAKNDKGQLETWSFECQAPNFFANRKIYKADFEKILGKAVTAEVHPARDGSPNGALWKIAGPDGKVLMAR